MHILLTRPLEDSKELIMRFKSLGHKVSHLPVINIKKKDYDEPNFEEFKGIIFTSCFLNIQPKAVIPKMTATLNSSFENLPNFLS